MSHLPSLWIAAALLVVGMLAQWVVLRARFRNEIFKQRARHQQHQQLLGQQLEQAKRQIGQLQLELARARVHAIQHAAARPVAPPRLVSVPRSPPEEVTSSRRSLPVDGFADTLPTPQFPHDVSLLRR